MRTLEGLYTIDEMDEDEEYEWTEEQQKLAEKQEEEYYEEKDELMIILNLMKIQIWFFLMNMKEQTSP